MMVVASSSASRMYAVAQLRERRSHRYLLTRESCQDGRGIRAPALIPHERRIRGGCYCDLECFLL